MMGSPDRPVRPIRVLIVDDHPVVRGGLAALLNSEADIDCCGAAADLSDAADRFDDLRPDVILVDLNLGDADGLELLRYLRSEWVGARAVVVSQHPPSRHGERARAAGAMGYVCKSEPPNEIVRAVRAVYHGFSYFTQSG